MSKFSGKCDFYDTFDMRDEDIDYFKKSDIFIRCEYGPPKKLVVNSIKDLIPYYPNIICSSGSSKERATIFLDEYSWIRREREKYGVSEFHYHYRKELNDELIKNGLEPIYSDNECVRGFWSKASQLPDLFLDKTIMKNYKNDMILLKDNEGNKYLAHTVNRILEIYSIIEVEDKDMDMIYAKEISYYELFRNKEFVYTTEYDIHNDELKCKKRKGSTIGKKYLPKENLYFMPKNQK